jgi:DNA-binding NarL/FixJ family response regulator
MTATNTVNVIILSEQALYVEALNMMLNARNGEYSSSTHSIKNPATEDIIKNQEPDIILMDANGMGKHIWEYLRETNVKYPAIKIIMLANSNEPIYLDYAAKNGASGYILKSSPQELLIASIKIALRNGKFFDPGVQTYNKNGYHHKIQEQYKLSTRELEIITFIKEGNTTKDVARILNLSHHTIETHRKKIYAKLQIKKVTDLLRIFAEYGD